LTERARTLTIKVEKTMPAEEVAPPKKKAAKKTKGPIDKAERGDVLVVIGKAGKMKAPAGVQVWNLEGTMPTEGGDRFAIAHLKTAVLYELGWVRRK
jgi:hypothetical protein